MTVLERLYRGVLLLYPRSFRRRYGAEMIAALRAREAEPRYAASRLGRLRLYAFVTEDVVRSLPREHRAARRTIFRNPRPDWTMDTLRQDLHFATRTLVSRPGFSLAIIATLALGIGATTTIFSVLDGVVLRPLPYPQDSSLVMLGSHTDRLQEFGPVSPFAFEQWRQHNEVFETMAAAYSQDMDLTGSGEPERLRVAGVSPDYFTLLGVAPIVGRGLLAADDVPGATPVVVLRNGLWQRRWGGDPTLVGDTIVLDGMARTVVGVLRPGFMPPEAMGHRDLEAWVPLQQTSIDTFDQRDFNLRVLARLRSGTSLARAREAMSSLAWALNRDAVAGGTGGPLAQESATAGGADANGDATAEGAASAAGGETVRQLSIRFDKEGMQVADAEASLQVAVASLRERTVGDSATGLLVLSGAVAFLLLIACANVASLQLTRAQDRAREVAVRSALGAGRGRLVRQLLTENILVALTGGALGVIVALAGVKLFVGLNPGDLPRLQQVSVDLRTLGFALLISLCAGIGFGIAPALQLVRGACAESLKEALPAAGPGDRRQRIRGLVVALETALALVLLIGAGLLVNSFVRLTSVDPGFEPSSATVMRVQLGDRYPEPAARTEFFRRLLDRIRSLPGVESAGAASLLPFTQRYNMSSFEPENPLEDPGAMNLAGFHEITAGLHRTLGTHLLRGRSFSQAEEISDADVVVVNETLARKYWGSTDVVGRRLRFDSDEQGGGWRTIIGVIADVKQFGLWSPASADVYVPFHGGPAGQPVHVAVRLGPYAPPIAAAMRRAVWALDSNVPVDEVFTMREAISGSVDEPRFYAAVLGAFAVSAMILAAVGISGTVAYNTARRYREIGIRRALGAGPRALVVLVARQGLTAVVVGLVAGCIGAYWLAGMLSSLLFQIEPTDAVTFAVVAAGLLVIATVACVVPARRATRIDPVSALRSC